MYLMVITKVCDKEDYKLIDVITKARYANGLKKLKLKLQDSIFTAVESKQEEKNSNYKKPMNSKEKKTDSFIKAFNNQLKNNGDSFVYETYTAIDKYMVTDTSVNTMSNLINKYSEYSLKDIITPEGENVTGSDYMEFYADENKLDQMILNLFYAEK